VARRALITGIGGQDGSLLAEFLLDEGYEVYGIVRRPGPYENLVSVGSRIELFEADLLDELSLASALECCRPHEVYNLASVSFAPASWDQPILTAEVTAVVLDSPMLDFSRTVDDNASREPLVGPIDVPPTLTWAAKQLAALRFDVDWLSLYYLTAGAAQFDVPTLVFHGEDDLTIPIATSEQLAELRPDTVELVRCPEADHIECWNVDPKGTVERVVAFLDQAVGSQA